MTGKRFIGGRLLASLLIVMLLRSILELCVMFVLEKSRTGSDENFVALFFAMDFKFIAMYCSMRAILIGWVWLIAMWGIVTSTYGMPKSKQYLRFGIGDAVFNYGAFLVIMLIEGAFPAKAHVMVAAVQVLFSLVYAAFWLLNVKGPHRSQDSTI